jgi:protein phosphatase
MVFSADIHFWSEILCPNGPRFSPLAHKKSNLMDPGFRALFDLYSSALSGDVSRYAERQSPLVLPRPEPALLSRLFHVARDLFELEPTLLRLAAPCVVVGDIHGQILDLFRILNTFGAPGRLTYLFLGDLVDRGEFSIEALVTVFLLKVLHPERVFLIRGNHEFNALCSHCGFMSQMHEFFQTGSLYDDAVRAFSQIPLAALIGQSTLCVHGGIGPSVLTASSVEWLTRPIDDFGDDILDSLVWSDPDAAIDGFAPSQSRGVGYAFGGAALAAFLEESHLTLLVRAHECVPDGARESFGGRLVTVFSASNYCGLMGNHAAVLEVTGPGAYQVHAFAPLPWLLRSSVQFLNAAGEARAATEIASGRRLKTGLAQSASDALLPAVKPGQRVAAFVSASSLPRLAPGKGISTLVAGEAAAGAQAHAHGLPPRPVTRTRLVKRGPVARDVSH